MTASIKTHDNKRRWYIRRDVFGKYIDLCIHNCKDLQIIQEFKMIKECSNIDFVIEERKEETLKLLPCMLSVAIKLANDKIMMEGFHFDGLDIIEWQTHFKD